MHGGFTGDTLGLRGAAGAGANVMGYDIGTIGTCGNSDGEHLGEIKGESDEEIYRVGKECR